ncbi:MAG: SDR family oxidoreductase [Chromatiales bacterium]|nr:SDR family oxidoreductase [Chromatiales bacterium]
MNVVITGSSRGIGLGLAREFLRRGHDVCISGRDEDRLGEAASELVREFPGRRIVAQSCDVADFAQSEALWQAAAAALGQIDIWVNNAGRDGAKVPFFGIPPEDYVQTVNTNLVGLMNCCRVVIPAMYAQGGGRIFNMEGFGSDGRIRPRIGPYGATKCALRYFTRVLVKELEGTPVRMCFLSPGMVLTGMLVPPPEKRTPAWQRNRKILNILADRVETVTPFLVEGMLRCERNGDAVRWLTGPKIAWRFASSLFRKRDVLSSVGA